MGISTLYRCPYEMMKSNSDPHLYTYEVELKRGYKYRHYYMIDGQEVVDDSNVEKLPFFLMQIASQEIR